MRLCSSMVMAGSLTLFYPALECQAQIFPQPDRLEALFPCSPEAAKSARCDETPRRVNPLPDDKLKLKNAPFYDVVVDNLCNTDVQKLAVQKWANDWLDSRFGTVRDRAIEVRASIGYRAQNGNRLRAHQTILAAGNLVDSPRPQFCQPSVIRGILRTERVNVTLQLYVADENGPKTSAAISAAESAAGSAGVGLAFGPVGAAVGGAVGGFFGGIIPAWASGSKTQHTEFVNKKAKVFETHNLVLGRLVPRGDSVYGYTVGNGQVSFTVHQEPRLEELEYYEQPEWGPGAWRPENAELWKDPPWRNPSPRVSAVPSLQHVVEWWQPSRSPTSVQASQRQARRAEKTSVAQNGWRPGFTVSAQAPAPQKRRAEKTSVAQNEWWQAPGFSAGALAARPAALPKTTFAYR